MADTTFCRIMRWKDQKDSADRLQGVWNGYVQAMVDASRINPEVTVIDADEARKPPCPWLCSINAFDREAVVRFSHDFGHGFIEYCALREGDEPANAAPFRPVVMVKFDGRGHIRELDMNLTYDDDARNCHSHLVDALIAEVFRAAKTAHAIADPARR